MRYTLNEWHSLEKDVSELIVQASSVNGNDDWQPFPIGMSWQVHEARNYLRTVSPRGQMLLCAINKNTDRVRRAIGPNRNIFVSTLESHGYTNLSLPAAQYFAYLPAHKFVVSPEGNGVDCHRHYEALMAGCIPIIERNPLIELKYRGCPVLYTTDYSEICDEYLSKVYADYLEREWDFSCLFLSHYDEDTQNIIKMCGNYWMNRITKANWY
jgi:hypothetical protein